MLWTIPRLSIVPHFDMSTKYDYTINDLILTQLETRSIDDSIITFFGIGQYRKIMMVKDYRNKGYSYEQIRDAGVISQKEYDGLKSMRKLDYSIIMQMMITPKSSNADTPPDKIPEEEVKKYASMYPSKKAAAYANGSKKLDLTLTGEENKDEDIDEEDIDEEDMFLRPYGISQRCVFKDRKICKQCLRYHDSIKNRRSYHKFRYGRRKGNQFF